MINSARRLSCEFWTERHVMARFLSASILILGIAFASTAHASILVGTIGSSNPKPSITSINGLIDDYNNDFGTSLAHVDGLIDKLEGGGWENGVYSSSDFDFFKKISSGTADRTVDIFDTPNVKFESISNPIGLERPAGFETDIDSFEYYVVKDGNKGWSLWLSMDGFNTAYIDSATNGFTRGAITNTNLDFDPIYKGISHISFWNAGDDSGGSGAIPEPSSVLTFAGIALCAFGGRVWRQRRRKARKLP